MVTFDQIYIRNLGFSFKFHKLKRVEELPLQEQLFCAVVRQAPDVVALLESTNIDCLQKLLDFLEKTGFGGLFLNALFDQSLVPNFNSAWNNHDKQFTAKLSHLSARESANSTQFESKFRDVLLYLNQEVNSLIWVKGAHLARTIYPDKKYRQFGDFDVIVRRNKVEAVIELLEEKGFVAAPIAANTNQFGAGPTRSVADLFLAPNHNWIPSSAVTMKFGTTYDVDIKLGPLDRGLQILEIERFFEDAAVYRCLEASYKAPSNVDHLMIMIRNLEKDRFQNWKSLMDVHLLAGSLNANELDWELFVARCAKEGIKTSAWTGLKVAENRFGSTVPSFVFKSLAPRWPNQFSFMAAPAYTWNSCGIPSLLFNAITAEDCQRKLEVLTKSLCPSREFLTAYFNIPTKLSGLRTLFYLFLYWYVLTVPAGVTRRSIGKKLWPNKSMLKQSQFR
ncbi:MAG TPA: nucleotidyltransferase family protein [Drouetiella sp.]